MTEADILRVVTEAGHPLSMSQMFEASHEPQYRRYVFEATVNQMAADGRLERMDAPKGSGSGVRSVYDVGRTG